VKVVIQAGGKGPRLRSTDSWSRDARER